MLKEFLKKLNVSCRLSFAKRDLTGEGNAAMIAMFERRKHIKEQVL